MDEIRLATNKAWVPGSDHFKEQISTRLNRPAEPSKKGGDRKSTAFKRGRNINRV
ncbi:MAG: hypothetical protein GY799_28515 [Desulfobulbaceae bacterium]|nr:hypothetical protein [Desulfobulbaceae bacterium]